MWALGIIKVEITTNRCARFSDAVVGFQIHLLIFDAAPQPLDEHVVTPSPFAVHADCNAVVGEHAGEGRPRELRTLVGIGDFRLAMLRQGILQRLDAECCFHSRPRKRVVNPTIAIDQGAIGMAKSHLKLVPPATVNRTVTPLRRKNADLRTREYLTPAEVE